MKLNKLVIAMGLASVALTACNSNSNGGTVPAPEADFTITAIDGYIVNGNVSTTCGDDVFTGRTNNLGVATIEITPYAADECASKIKGDAETYDADDGEDTAWLHTMNTLPGQAVINPFTNIAFTFSQLTDNESLSVDELKNKVLDALGFDDNHEAAAVLFANYAATASTDDTAAATALLAQGTFDATVEANKELGEKTSPANLASLFDNILETVQESVTKQIENTKAEGNKLSDSVITVVVTLPDLDFSEDGTIKTDNLKYLAVGSVTQEKSELTDPVKVAEATKSAAKAAQENAEAAVAAAPAAEKIARQAVTAKVVVKKAEAQQVVAEKIVAKAEAVIASATPEAKAAAEAALEAAKAAVKAAEASKEAAKTSAAAAKATAVAEETFNNATGEAKAAAEKALEAAKAAAEAELAKVKAAEKAAEAAEKAAEEAAEEVAKPVEPVDPVKPDPVDPVKPGPDETTGGETGSGTTGTDGVNQG